MNTELGAVLRLLAEVKQYEKEELLNQQENFEDYQEKAEKILDCVEAYIKYMTWELDDLTVDNLKEKLSQFFEGERRIFSCSHQDMMFPGSSLSVQRNIQKAESYHLAAQRKYHAQAQNIPSSSDRMELKEIENNRSERIDKARENAFPLTNILHLLDAVRDVSGIFTLLGYQTHISKEIKQQIDHLIQKIETAVQYAKQQPNAHSLSVRSDFNVEGARYGEIASILMEEVKQRAAKLLEEKIEMPHEMVNPFNTSVLESSIDSIQPGGSFFSSQNDYLGPSAPILEDPISITNQGDNLFFPTTNDLGNFSGFMEEIPDENGIFDVDGVDKDMQAAIELSLAQVELSTTNDSGNISGLIEEISNENWIPGVDDDMQAAIEQSLAQVELQEVKNEIVSSLESHLFTIENKLGQHHKKMDSHQAEVRDPSENTESRWSKLMSHSFSWFRGAQQQVGSEPDNDNLVDMLNSKKSWISDCIQEIQDAASSQAIKACLQEAIQSNYTLDENPHSEENLLLIKLMQLTNPLTASVNEKMHTI